MHALFVDRGPLSLQESLAALAVLTTVSETDSNEVTEHLPPDTAPPPVEAEKLLPVVHTTWGFLLPNLLPSAAAARTEQAAALLAHVATLAGGFIASRFERDAVPLLLRLLHQDRATSWSGDVGSGGYKLLDDGPATGTRNRRHLAALACITSCCVSVQGRLAVADVVSALAEGSLASLAAAGSAQVAEGALRALRCLSAVDADSVWLLVRRVMHCEDQACRHGASSTHAPQLQALDVRQGRLGAAWHGRAIAWKSQCAKLLRDIEAVQPAWHAVVREGRVLGDSDAGPWVVAGAS